VDSQIGVTLTLETLLRQGGFEVVHVGLDVGFVLYRRIDLESETIAMYLSATR